MRACLAFFRMRLVNGLQYRTAAYAGIFTQFFWGFMEIQLYGAFYRENPENFPMEFSHLVSYIWLRQAFLRLLDTWSTEQELFDMILNGNVAYELCRPASLYGMWFARNVALRLSSLALRCWPILLVAALLPDPWGLRLPPSAGAFAAAVLSMALALGVVTAYILIIYFSCFFTLSSEGTRAVMMPLVGLLAGELIPLPFMPDGLAKVLSWLPFVSISNAPLRIYSGDIAGAEAAGTMLLQAFWLVALALLGWWMQRRGMRRLCVQGG